VNQEISKLIIKKARARSKLFLEVKEKTSRSGLFKDRTNTEGTN
jgi:hypothetical protein